MLNSWAPTCGGIVLANEGGGYGIEETVVDGAVSETKVARSWWRMEGKIALPMVLPMTLSP